MNDPRKVQRIIFNWTVLSLCKITLIYSKWQSYFDIEYATTTSICYISISSETAGLNCYSLPLTRTDAKHAIKG